MKGGGSFFMSCSVSRHSSLSVVYWNMSKYSDLSLHCDRKYHTWIFCPNSLLSNPLAFPSLASIADTWEISEPPTNSDLIWSKLIDCCYILSLSVCPADHFCRFANPHWSRPGLLEFHEMFLMAFRVTFAVARSVVVEPLRPHTGVGLVCKILFTIYIQSICYLLSRIYNLQSTNYCLDWSCWWVFPNK